MTSLPRLPGASFRSRLAAGAALSALLAGLASAPAAFAQTAADSLAPSQQQSPVPGPINSSVTPEGGAAPGEPGFMTNLWTRSNLLGDIGGLRTWLARYGVSLGLSETSEVQGNVNGGVHRGAAYQGLAIMSLGIDTQPAFGWDGGTFNVSALQIHGRNLSADNLYTLQTSSGIQATRATRLWELWYMQQFAGGLFDVKVGQQSIDNEFMTSAGSSLFINTMMGWPMVPSVDLYGGGPAYPMSSLGVRLRGSPMRNMIVQGGVFDDNPAGGPFFDDSQVRGAAQSGAAFNLNNGALVIGEVQYAINQPADGDMVTDPDAPQGLPGVYKLGFWYDSARFPSYSQSSNGLPLASPYGTADNKFLGSNFSLYGVFDQMIWRPNPGEQKAIGVFARVMGAPGDRNFVNFSVNAGITVKAPIEGRDDDTFGIGYGYAQLSPTVRSGDRDLNFYGTPTPVRGSESFVEITYQAAVTPWLVVQPDIQYTFMPGGGVPNPLQPGTRVRNELVLGLRTNIVF